MSAVDGWALLAYQGARARCSAASAGSWPAVAYQQVVMAWPASWNGTVRSTPAGVSLLKRDGLWQASASSDHDRTDRSR